jgi:PIN domain nuclease of toxin-antitoxin system
VPVDAAIALAAGRLPDGFPGDPTDRLIYATAIVRRVALVTRDERITAHDPQRCRW